jgi:hypothetical protein
MRRWPSRAQQPAARELASFKYAISLRADRRLGRVGVELLKRSGGNLRAVQEHVRHADTQTTTIYTRLAPQDLQKVVNLFDEKNGGTARASDRPFGSRKRVRMPPLARYEQTVLSALEDTENALVAYGEEQGRQQRLAEAVDASQIAR